MSRYSVTPTKALGTVAEAECSRVVAAIDLAEKLNAPVEWFALSSGATISMESGTENMDWVSPAACAGSSPFTPERRRDQHRRHGHQRRRSGPTGTPKPPC